MSTDDLICMGMRFDGASIREACKRNVDIETMILDITDVFPVDSRLASVFLSWIAVHGKYVIVEKLAKFAARRSKEENAFPWLSMAAAWAVECGCHKWRKLVKPFQEPQYLYPQRMTESAIRLKGAISWLDAIGFRIPQNSIRIREEDVFSPEELMRHNLQYKNRYLYGASWRADIITAIQRGITSPTEIRHAVGCSYEPAYRISREYLLASSSRSLFV